MHQETDCQCPMCAEIVLTEEGARKLAELLTRPPRIHPKLAAALKRHRRWRDRW